MFDKATKKLIGNIIFKYLDGKKYKAFIFGSWALGNNRKYSDIDIGIKGKNNLPVDKKIKIEEAFERSDLPYMIQIVDFNNADKSFKKEALKKTIPLN